MNSAQRKELNLQHPLMEFLQVSGVNVALIVVGMVLMGAEAWLLVTTSIVLGGSLLALTGFTMFLLVGALWEDWS